MSTPSQSPLIAPETLQAQDAHHRLLVLDLRSRQSYESGHIPGSVHSDYETDGWRVQADGGLGMLPSSQQLSELFGRLGLDRGDQIVIVTAGLNASDLAAAARVYWTLKMVRHPSAAILDGGFRAWSMDPSRPVESGPGQTRPATSYPVIINDALRSTLDATASALRQGGATFIDARSAAQFEGREKAGSVKTAGHLPGAQLFDYALNLDPDTMRILPKEVLAQRFSAVGEEPLINYCNTGHTAALNWFVLSEVLGRPNVRLFDGSMSQWSQDPRRPVVTGPAKG
jgi:thiosulfate/3-mercaptopyruvate sulfurtransferase